MNPFQSFTNTLGATGSNKNAQVQSFQNFADRFSPAKLPTQQPGLFTPAPTQTLDTGMDIPNNPTGKNMSPNTGPSYKGVAIDTSQGDEYTRQQMQNIDAPKPGINPTSVDLKIDPNIPSSAMNTTGSPTTASEGRKNKENSVLTSRYSREEEKLLKEITSLRKGVASLQGTQAREFADAELNPEGMFGPNALNSNLSRLSKDQALELNARTGQLNAYLDNLELYQGYRPQMVGTPQIDEATGNAFAYIQDPQTGQITTQSLGQIATPVAPKSEDFTLGKDQVRFDAQGNPIAYGGGGSGTGSGLGSYGGTGIKSDLARMIDVQGSYIASENQRNAYERAANGYLERGDYAGFKTYLRNQSVNNLPAAEQSGYKKNIVMLSALDTAAAALDKLEALGVNTGILSGSWQAIQNKLGAQATPEMNTLAYQAKNAMDILKRERTGAAVNAYEDEFYKQLVPSIFKGYDLNKQIVNEFRSMLSQNTDSYLQLYFGQDELNTLDAAAAGPVGDKMKEFESLVNKLQ